MGRSSNQMVTFIDLQYMVDNEGYSIKNNFSATVQCATKAECSDALHLDETGAEWIAWASNRLVPYRLLSPLDVTYVGVSGVCIDSDDPNPTAPTPPTIVLTSQSQSAIGISWTASPGSSPNGTISAYDVQVKANDGTSTWQTITPQLSGATTTYSHTSVTAYIEYTFRVRLVDSTAVSSDWSNEISAVAVTDSPTTAVLPLSLTWDTGALDLWGEFKAQGDLDTTIVHQIEVTSSSGTWYIKESTLECGIRTIQSTVINGNTPYTWTSCAKDTTNNAGGGYYYAYLNHIYGDDTGGACTITCKIVSATGYAQADLPAPITKILS